MQLDELLVAPDRIPTSELEQFNDGPDDITLTQFSDEDDIPDDLRELSELLVGVESAVQARMILSFFLPEYEWGGKKA